MMKLFFAFTLVTLGLCVQLAIVWAVVHFVLKFW